MDWPIVIILIAITFAAVLAFAWRSKQTTEERLEKDEAPKSTLAKDKSDHGKPADV